MLHWIQIEWLRLRAIWALLWLTPKARQAVLNTSAATWEKIDAELEKRRERLQLQGSVQAFGLPPVGVPETRSQSPGGPLVP